MVNEQAHAWAEDCWTYWRDTQNNGPPEQNLYLRTVIFAQEADLMLRQMGGVDYRESSDHYDYLTDSVEQMARNILEIHMEDYLQPTKPVDWHHGTGMIGKSLYGKPLSATCVNACGMLSTSETRNVSELRSKCSLSSCLLK